MYYELHLYYKTQNVVYNVLRIAPLLQMAA